MIKKLQALKAKKGFTLVELIVVIAIIGVLAAILVPTMLGYVTSSQVTSKNSTAASIKNSVDNFLTDADTKGYGMLKGTGNNGTIEFAINESGVWTATGVYTAADNKSAFKTGGSLKWSAKGEGQAAKSKTAATCAEDLLCIELADLFPTVKSAYAWVYIEGGKCMYALYTEDTASTPAKGDVPVKDDFAKGVFAWNGSTAGVTANGFTVGTAPALDLATAADNKKS